MSQFPIKALFSLSLTTVGLPAATASAQRPELDNDLSQRAFKCDLAYFSGSASNSFHITKYLPESSGEEIGLAGTGLSVMLNSFKDIMSFSILRNDPAEGMTKTSFRIKDGFVSFDAHLGSILGQGSGSGSPQLEVTCWGSYDQIYQ